MPRKKMYLTHIYSFLELSLIVFAITRMVFDADAALRILCTVCNLRQLFEVGQHPVLLGGNTVVPFKKNDEVLTRFTRLGHGFAVRLLFN